MHCGCIQETLLSVILRMLEVLRLRRDWPRKWRCPTNPVFDVSRGQGNDLQAAPRSAQAKWAVRLRSGSIESDDQNEMTRIDSDDCLPSKVNNLLSSTVNRRIWEKLFPHIRSNTNWRNCLLPPLPPNPYSLDPLRRLFCYSAQTNSFPKVREAPDARTRKCRRIRSSGRSLHSR